MSGEPSRSPPGLEPRRVAPVPARGPRASDPIGTVHGGYAATLLSASASGLVVLQR